MGRHDKAGGSPVKTPRRKKLGRRNTAKVARRRKSSTADAADRIAVLTLERDEALERQRATYEVLKVISSSPGEAEPVFKAMLESALRICEAEFGMLMQYNSREGSFDTRVMVGASPALVDALLHQPFTPPSGNPLDRMLRTKKTVHVVDAAAETAKPLSAQLAGARSHISVPMLKENEVVGSISVYRAEVRPFTDKQIELVTNFAAQAVIAIENTRLLHELRESVQQQTATADVLKVISRSAFNLQTVLDTLVESATRLCKARDAIIFLPSGKVYRAEALHGYSTEYHKFIESNPITINRGSVVGRTAIDKQLVHISDVLTDPNYTRLDAQKMAGFRTALGVPLLREGNVVGVIFLTRTKVRPFTEKQIELITTFADQAIIAIENARLFEEVQQKTRGLEEALVHQIGSANILKVIASSQTDIEPVLNVIVDNACAICKAVDAVVYLKDGNHLRAEAHHGSIPIPADSKRLPINRMWVTGRAFVDKAPVNVRDLQGPEGDEFPDARQHVILMGHRAVLAVPLLREGESVGVIVLRRTEAQLFTDKQSALLQTFADQAVIAIENTRLFNETTRALEQQTATADILKVIASSPSDVQPVFEAIAERSNRLVNGLSTAVYSVVDDTAHLMAFTRVSPAADAALQAAFPAPLLQFGGDQALNKGTMYCVVDSETEFATRPSMLELSRLRGWRSSLAVPLLRAGKLIGLITVTRAEPGYFDDHHVQLLKIFADQAVIAISNVGLFNEVQARTQDLTESLQQQTATSEVLQVISSSPGELEPVFQAMLANAMRICEAKFGIMYEFANGKFRAMSWAGVPPAYADYVKHSRVWGPGTGLGQLVRTKQTVHIRDVVEGSAYAEGDPGRVATIDLGRVRTALIVPMLRENELVGAFVIYRQEVRPFTDKQVALVENFAAQAVIAIENTRLLNELRESLQQQTATADVLKIINRSSVDLETVLDTLVETVTRLCRADYSTMYRQRDDKYHLVAAYGALEEVKEFVRTHPFVPDRGTLTGRVGLERRVVHIPDALSDPEYTYHELQKIAGYRSMLGVPLLRGDELIGTFSLHRTRVEPFTSKEIDLASSFADQAMIAIENARLFEELRERQAELRVTFDNMGDGVVMFDTEARLTAWNRNFQEMLELPEAFLAGRPSWAEFFRYLADRGEYSTDLAAELSRTIDDISREMRFERTRPDGRVMEVRRNPVPGGGFVLIYADITERKRAEEAIRIARDAAEMALHELQIAQASLVHAQKMAALGQVTAGIAHEIKNPLNFVNNFAGLSVELLDELKDVAAQAIGALETGKRAEVVETIEMLTGNLEKIVEHGRRADGIVRSMLQHSRGGSGEWQATDLNALVEEALNLAYHGARSQDQSFDISLECDLDRNLASVDIVPQEMTRVLLNLIGNGFYAASKRSRDNDGTYSPVLKVMTREFGESVEVRVRDNGVGVPPENRDKLFQPFFTTKPTGEGTGLGLSISYEIVSQLHGGTMTVDSKVGDFTEFTVRLPRQRRAAAG